MNAGQKWLQLALDVVFYEVDHMGDGQLLSEGTHRLVAKRPIAGRVFILCAGAVITLHLSATVDERYDILSQHFWKMIQGRYTS